MDDFECLSLTNVAQIIEASKKKLLSTPKREILFVREKRAR